MTIERETERAALKLASVEFVRKAFGETSSYRDAAGRHFILGDEGSTILAGGRSVVEAWHNAIRRAEQSNVQTFQSYYAANESRLIGGIDA